MVQNDTSLQKLGQNINHGQKIQMTVKIMSKDCQMLRVQTYIDLYSEYLSPRINRHALVVQVACWNSDHWVSWGDLSKL